MDALWLNIATILFVFTVAIISPGPNFIFVVNRSITGSRRIGFYSAFGVATGSGIFAISGLLGLIMLITALPFFSVIMRYLGGGYLLYLGISMLLSIRHASIVKVGEGQSPNNAMAPIIAYYTGLLTNLTNPKAWAFYLSLFTLMIENDLPLWAKTFLAISMFLISFCWYSLMVLLISDHRLQKRFVKVETIIKTVLGSVLFILGGKLLWRG